jgi:Ca2+-binding RTX toxin-like protein
VIVGGAGADTLIGGTGSDRFVYTALTDAGDLITDFGNGDLLDLRDLFRALNYTGSNAIADGYLRLVKVGGNTQVQLDAKNGAGFITLVTLNGVAPEQLAIGQTLLV